MPAAIADAAERRIRRTITNATAPMTATTTRIDPTTATPRNIALLPPAVDASGVDVGPDGADVDADALDTVIVADSWAICSVADAWSLYSAATAGHVAVVPPFSGVLDDIPLSSDCVTSATE